MAGRRHVLGRMCFGQAVQAAGGPPDSRTTQMEDEVLKHADCSTGRLRVVEWQQMRWLWLQLQMRDGCSDGSSSYGMDVAAVEWLQL